MRYRIVAVGGLGRGFLADGCAHYLKRLERLAPTEVREVRAGKGTPDAVRASEAASLSRLAVGRRVVLDERGRSRTTAELAEHVTARETAGDSRIALLIGGAEGTDPALRDGADEVWRLSDLTLPHELARLVLLEQLYRIETVRAGHPYHRA